jgi:hypothetical protein
VAQGTPAASVERLPARVITPRPSVLPLALALLNTGATACGPAPVPAQRVHGQLVVDGLLLQATTRIWGTAPESVGVTVRVTSQRPDSMDVRSGCALYARFVRVAGAGARPGTPAAPRPAARWNRLLQTFPVPQADGSVKRVPSLCPLVAFTTRLAPGDTAVPPDFVWREALDVVRGDSLRGAYRVVARLEQFPSVGRGVAVEVPAGTVQLP